MFCDKKSNSGSAPVTDVLQAPDKKKRNKANGKENDDKAGQ